MDRDLKFLQVAAAATCAAADGLKADNDAALEKDRALDTRFQKMAAIEEAIMSARPDFLECAELVDAIRASIDRRQMPDEVRESLAVYGKAFRDALDRADDEAEVRQFPDLDAQREASIEDRIAEGRS